MVALRKQIESQTSLPWKVRQREDSSPLINKAGRERGSFYKFKLLKTTPGMFGEQDSSSTHPTATQTSSPSRKQPVCRQALFPVIREGEEERGLRAGSLAEAELEELSPGIQAGTLGAPHTQLDPSTAGERTALALSCRENHGPSLQRAEGANWKSSGEQLTGDASQMRAALIAKMNKGR